MFLKKISLFLTLFLIFACAPKSVITGVERDTLAKIAEKNRIICAYKGRITLDYTKDDENVHLKGYLDKQCSKDFRLVITGPLNIVMLDVTYKDGVVNAKRNGEDMSLLASYLFKAKNADTLVGLIRYPYAEVDPSFSIDTDGTQYILKKDGIIATAGADYLITSVTDGRKKFSYEYRDGTVYNIIYENGTEKVEIGLR